MWFADLRSIIITLRTSSPNRPSILTHAELWGVLFVEPPVHEQGAQLASTTASSIEISHLHVYHVHKILFLIIFHVNALMVVHLIFGGRRH